MSAAEKLRNPTVLIPWVVAAAFFIWGASQAWGSFQTVAQVKATVGETLAPVAKALAQNTTRDEAQARELIGFKVLVAKDIAAIKTNAKNVHRRLGKQGDKLDKLLELTVETREMARSQSDTRQRARGRSAAKRVREQLANGDDDPLGGLDGI